MLEDGGEVGEGVVGFGVEAGVGEQGEVGVGEEFGDDGVEDVVDVVGAKVDGDGVK